MQLKSPDPHPAQTLYTPNAEYQPIRSPKTQQQHAYKIAALQKRDFREGTSQGDPLIQEKKDVGQRTNGRPASAWPERPSIAQKRFLILRQPGL